MSSGTAPISQHSHTLTGWDVVDTAPTPERTVEVGSCFLVGNGALGYRGTRPDQRAADFVGCVVADTYDMADGVWRELCTAPNGLFVSIELDGQPLTIDPSRPAEIELTLATGEVTSRWHAGTPAGATALVSMRRFAGLHDLHLLAQQLTVVPDADATVTIIAGIDDDVWSLNGNHFASVTTEVVDDLVTSRCVTVERGTELAVATRSTVDGLAALDPADPTDAADPSGADPSDAVDTVDTVTSTGDAGITARRWRGRATAGSAVTVETAMGVATSNDDDVDPTDAGGAMATAIQAVRTASADGYRASLGRSAAAWESFWDTADVRVEGDPAAQAALRFSIYHNRIATPAHVDRLPIGARGLSCQAYQGAAFWDQEMFNLPAYLHTLPHIARRLLVYRWRTLDGARRKAQRLGYRGAYYAWISGDTGDELCPDFFFVDVLTGRPIRNHFNVWQMHISPDIAHAVWRYWEATGDLDFLADHGAEIVFEVARFLHSFARYDEVNDRYEFIRLLGPDEWHENVDNNTYTARIGRLALRHASEIRALLASERPDALDALDDRLGLTSDDVEAWERLEAKLFEHRPDPETLLIEPFDHFFELEDCRPADLRERLLDPGEYWGWPNGVAVHTQVSKQPDVVQMFAIDPSVPLEVQRANYLYFEPRCSHGSSLSHSVHATVAARLGDDPVLLDQAYEYFMDTAALDLRTTVHSVVGGTFIGGMHTAANAGAYQTAVFGFGGLTVADGVVSIAPRLPPTWTALEYTVVAFGQRLDVRITAGPESTGPDSSASAVSGADTSGPAGGGDVWVVVTASSANTEPVAVRLAGSDDPVTVTPGERLTG